MKISQQYNTGSPLIGEDKSGKKGRGTQSRYRLPDQGPDVQTQSHPILDVIRTSLADAAMQTAPNQKE